MTYDRDTAANDRYRSNDNRDEFSSDARRWRKEPRDAQDGRYGQDPRAAGSRPDYAGEGRSERGAGRDDRGDLQSAFEGGGEESRDYGRPDRTRDTGERDVSWSRGRYDPSFPERESPYVSRGFRGGERSFGERASSADSDARALGRGAHAGKGPKGYTRSDERIREDVCDRLTAHGEIDASDVDVKVQGGEVVLEGTIGDRRMKQAAENVCCEVAGVKDVDNRIKVRKNDASEASSTSGTRFGSTASGTAPTTPAAGQSSTYPAKGPTTR